MDVKDHTTSAVANGSVRMRGGVVQKPHRRLVGLLGSFGLVGGNGTNRDKHGRVDSDAVIQQGANNLLDAVDVLGG